MSVLGSPSRRMLLRGAAGALVGLPMFEPAVNRQARAATPGNGAPIRFVAYFVGNGFQVANLNPDEPARFLPRTEGTGFQLSETLMPLAPFKNKLLVLSGVSNDKHAWVHEHGAACFLSCTSADDVGGSKTISADQVAAQQLKAVTRRDSLVLGMAPVGKVGTAISYAGPGRPVPKLSTPGEVFDAIFADGAGGAAAGAADRARRLADRRSLLDYVLGDAQRLSRRLGRADQEKLDQYLGSVREIERRIAAQTTASSCTPPERPTGDADIPTKHALMLDLVALAFQCDVTRVVTFAFYAPGGTGQRYDFLGLPGDGPGHHTMSHAEGGLTPAELDRRLYKIERWHIEQFARLLGKLDAVDEGNGTMLDNSIIHYGSDCGNGRLHTYGDHTYVMAGRGGGAIKTGSYVRYVKRPYKGRLMVSMLNAVGVMVDRFGDPADQTIGPLI